MANGPSDDDRPAKAKTTFIPRRVVGLALSPSSYATSLSSVAINGLRRCVQHLGVFLALVIPILVNLILVPIANEIAGHSVARHLVTTLSIAGIISPALTLGVPGPLTRDIVQGAVDSHKVRHIRLVLAGSAGCLALATVVVALGGAVGPWVAVIVAAQALNLVGQGIWRGTGESGRFFFGSLVVSLALAVSFVLSLAGERLLAAAVGGLMLGVLAALFYQRRPAGSKLERPYIAGLIRDSIPLVPHSVGVMAITQSFRLWVGLAAPSDKIVVLNTVSTLAAAAPTLFSLMNQTMLAEFFRNAKTVARRMSTLVGAAAFFGALCVVSVYIVTRVVIPHEYDAVSLLMGSQVFFQAQYLLFVNFLFLEHRTRVLGMLTPICGLIALALAFLGAKVGDATVAAASPVVGWLLEGIGVILAVTSVGRNPKLFAATVVCIGSLVVFGVVIFS